MGRGRRAFNILGVLVLVLLLGGIGFFISSLARQAGRSSHWFLHAQLAQDLADAGLKQAVWSLERDPKRPPAGFITRLFDGPGAPDSSTLVDGTSTDPLIASQIVRLTQQGFTAKLTVTGKVLSEQDLVEPSSLPSPAPQPFPIPKAPGERSGHIRLTAVASVKGPVGVAVERTITLDRSYKIVSILPPLLGRFSFFVQEHKEADDVNFVNAFYESDSGSSHLEPGSPQPLRVISSRPELCRQVADDSTVDRQGYVDPLPADFIDQQGWVYLGGEKWTLGLTHGFGMDGETPLIPGDRRVVSFLDPGTNAPDDAGFKTRFTSAWDAAAGTPCHADFNPPFDGLVQVATGIASNYELLTIDTAYQNEVEEDDGRRKAIQLGDLKSSALHLCGDGHDFAPTLVFGPVYHGLMRRTQVHVTIASGCALSGTPSFNCYRLADYGPNARTVLEAAFNGVAGYELNTAFQRNTDPYAQCLNVALDVNNTAEINSDGTVSVKSPRPQPKTFGSSVITGFVPLPRAGGFSAAELTRLQNGDLDAPKLYKGSLQKGLDAFFSLVWAKRVYAIETPPAGAPVSPQAAPPLPARLLDLAGNLNVPGVVLIRGGAPPPQPLTLSGTIKVASGGILVNNGPITIKGPIRGKPGEPLTLVAQSGDITVDPGAGTVDAYLVAYAGKVIMRNADVTIKGGVATRQLDLEMLKTAGRRTIAYDRELDPVGPPQSSLRLYFGNDPAGGVPRVTFSGEAAP